MKKMFPANKAMVFLLVVEFIILISGYPNYRISVITIYIFNLLFFGEIRTVIPEGFKFESAVKNINIFNFILLAATVFAASSDFDFPKPYENIAFIVFTILTGTVFLYLLHIGFKFPKQSKVKQENVIH